MLPILLLLTPVWTSFDVYTSWTNQGSGYEYVYEIYTDRELNNLYLESVPTTNTSITVTLSESNLYFQRVKYYPIGTTDFNYDFLGQFYLNLENGYFGEDIVYFPPVEEEQPPDIYEEDEEEEIEGNIVLPTPIVSTPKYIFPQDIDMREDVVIRNESVLGSSTKMCNIYIFRYEGKSDTSLNCSTGLNISSIEYVDWGKYLTLQVDGTYLEKIYASVKVFECSKFNIFNPNTWFGCQKVLVDSYTGDIRLKYYGYLTYNGTAKQNITSKFLNTSFFVENMYVKSYYGNDIYGSDVKLKVEVTFSTKGKEWIDGVYHIQKTIKVPKLVHAPSTKPFDFPLEKYIGVTQWHGCTVYQCPHKAIDFGAYLNRVISVGDGTVVSAGYDKYGGECNQGGRYVIVKHINGMYSSYFHLDSYSVRVGDVVKKGEVIGISGNSGRWNCQKLGYHLHFDIRKGRDSSTHVNPVEYINVDWNLIPTLGYRQYPGRLSGDNPHPNF